VEPSAAMRAVLLSRVADSEDLRRRVTVLAEDLQTARLPDRFSAVIAMNVIGTSHRTTVGGSGSAWPTGSALVGRRC
jgi:hypothetical protein